MGDWYRDSYGPYGNPSHTLEYGSSVEANTRERTVEEICDYISTLNDMYHWNDWVVEKIREKFCDPQTR